MKIGVVIDPSQRESMGAAPTFAEMKGLALAAEASGIDSIWLFDHLLFRDESEPETTSGIWECWSLLAALAALTERVELGTLVLCTPFRNPALLAKMAHTVDEVSGGRLILGVGAGWHKPEFDAFGYPFDHRASRFEEAMQVVAPLLRGESVTFSGSYHHVQNAIIKPLGPRPEGIPLLIAAGGPRMLRLTNQYADQWNTAWLGADAGELAERLDRLAAAGAETGREPGSLGITVGVSAAFPDLGDTNPFARSEPLTGAPADLVPSLRAYEAAGVDHLIVQVTPPSVAAVERLGEAAGLYRA